MNAWCSVADAEVLEAERGDPVDADPVNNGQDDCQTCPGFNISSPSARSRAVALLRPMLPPRLKPPLPPGRDGGGRTGALVPVRALQMRKRRTRNASGGAWSTH